MKYLKFLIPVLVIALFSCKKSNDVAPIAQESIQSTPKTMTINKNDKIQCPECHSFNTAFYGVFPGNKYVISCMNCYKRSSIAEDQLVVK